MIEEFKDLKEVQMIVFRLGKEEYTVPIMSVQEIIMPQKPTHIPKSPTWIEGVLNLRGHIIPIIDGKKKFSLEGSDENTINQRIVVFDVKKKIVGLIVDEVSEVIHLQTEDIEPAPIDMDQDNDFIWGIGKHQDRLLILINPQRFLSNSEVSDLESFSRITEAIQQTKEIIEAKSAS